MPLFRVTVSSTFRDTASSAWRDKAGATGGDSMSTDIGISRVQVAFAVKETSTGTLAWPSASHQVLPAGDAVINQSPDFVNSEEKRDSLDVLDQFQAAMPAGSFTLPTYVRPGGSIGSDPQGSSLYESLLGEKTTAACANFATVTQTSAVLYRPATTAPSFSLWLKTDHFVQALSGCTVQQGVLSVSNEGAVKFEFSGQGMKMYWAGTDAVQTDRASAASSIIVADADRFKPGIRIYNSTQDLTNGGSGWTIATINTATNKLTLSATLGATWSSGDVVAGYLPSGTTIGSPIEGKDTTIKINGVSASIKNSSITFSCPKQYITDEVGTTYPTAYMEDEREISMDVNVYFRKADAKYFNEGYSGNTVPLRIEFGTTAGSRLLVHFQKVRLRVPEINFAAPAVELNMPGRALGTNGEDSVDMIFR